PTHSAPGQQFCATQAKPQQQSKPHDEAAIFVLAIATKRAAPPKHRPPRPRCSRTTHASRTIERSKSRTNRASQTSKPLLLKISPHQGEKGGAAPPKRGSLFSAREAIAIRRVLPFRESPQRHQESRTDQTFRTWCLSSFVVKDPSESVRNRRNLGSSGSYR